MFKQWNPKWKLKFDYSEAELLDLESSMPGVKVYLCDFHREQTWERWVKTISMDSQRTRVRKPTVWRKYILATIPKSSVKANFEIQCESILGIARTFTRKHRCVLP